MDRDTLALVTGLVILIGGLLIVVPFAIITEHLDATDDTDNEQEHPS